jgi:NAD(P)-dependent dehydrogenase (short-subunit alcohol dehydrogenase family)
LTQQTWFITGASSGFGHVMTEKLLARGDRVAATLRKMNALDDLKATYGEQLWIAALDVSNVSDVRRVVDLAFAELGRIDVVVNNAGYGVFGAAEELTDDQIRHQIDTNVIGSIQVVRAALPHLRSQGGGRVIQVSSEGGQIAYPSFSLYHASKWGIEGFIESVAQEVAPFNIEFTIIEPGPTKTGFRQGLVRSTPLAAYDATAVGEMRRAFASGGFARPGDPVKMGQVIIDSVARSPAPKRIALGSASYTRIRTALVARLAELDAQKDLAASTDLDPV